MGNGSSTSAGTTALTRAETAQDRTAARLEAQAGGRAALVEVLLPAVRTKDVETLVGILDDPRNAGVPIGEILAEARIPAAALLRLYSEAQLIAAQTASQMAIAQALPRVAESVMARGAPHRAVCVVCEGCGTVTPEPTAVQPNPAPVACAACYGTGQVLWNPTPAHERTALELGQLLTKTPAIAVAVNQHTNVQVGAVAETVDAFTRVSDRLVHGDGRGRMRRVGSGSTATGEASPADAG